ALRLDADDSQPAETPRINKAQFASGSKLEHRVRMLQRLGIRRCNLQTPCHAKVNNPLSMSRARPIFTCVSLKIKHNMLSNASYASNPRVLQNSGDFPRWRLQRLRLIAQPNRVDYIARHPLVESARDGFNLRKFRHKQLV